MSPEYIFIAVEIVVEIQGILTGIWGVDYHSHLCYETLHLTLGLVNMVSRKRWGMNEVFRNDLERELVDGLNYEAQTFGFVGNVCC